jgi:hypothetical protein
VNRGLVVNALLILIMLIVVTLILRLFGWLAAGSGW